MANAKIRGITVEIGGDTTKLGKALQNSEQNTKALQSELRQVDKLLKFDPSNTELLAQKQKILTDTVGETTEKLKLLEQAQEQVIKQFERGDIGEDQLRAFQREIIETQSKLGKFEQDLDGVVNGLQEVGDEAEDSGEGFTVMRGALADLTSSAIQGAIGSIGNLIGSLMELSEATEEYRVMQAKLEGSSNSFGYSMDFASSKYEQFYGYLGDDQMATNAITNLLGLGTSTENISAVAESAIAVWSAYGDSIPIEGLTEAINETAQVGTVTGSLADALNWAGISEDAFNEKLAKLSTTEERANLIAKTLNDTYGASKTTYDELNGSITEANRAELEFKDTQAQLGETMAPVNTAITQLKNEALEAVTPLVEKLANAFMTMYEWLSKNPEAVRVLTGVVIALASAFTVLAGALAIQGLITGVTKAMALLNTTLLANPVTLVVALIAGLVASFIYLWNNVESFRNFWIKAWDFMKTIVTTAINKTVEFLTALPGKIKDAISGAIQTVTDWGNNVKTTAVNAIVNTVSSIYNTAKELPNKIYNAISGAVGKLATWGKNMLSQAKSSMRSVASGIINELEDLPGDIFDIGTDIVHGLWDGINSGWSWLTNKVASLARSLLDSAKKALDINSPSGEFRDQVGRYIAEGIGVGITENADAPIGALNKLSDSMLSGDLNGSTINRRLSNTFGATPQASGTDNGLLGALNAIYERLDRMQIVLDTGTLVGETIDKIDAGLASRQTLAFRGV